MYDISTEEGRREIAVQIVSDINDASLAMFGQERRTHLGGSEIGEECSRKLYYKFRWCWQETFIARMLRLFNVGHREEPMFIEYLRASGFQVWEADVDTKKQFRISGAKGHFGGSLDGKAIAPERYGIGTEPLLTEYKTMATKIFCKLVEEKSVAKVFPKYYAQMCIYGYKTGIRYAVFLAGNKNDSDIYCEVLPLNHNFGQSLEVKANEIVFAKEPPPRISETPTDYKCTYCFAKDGCHNGKPVEKNCRSCRHSEPVDNAEWHCHLYKQNVPADFIVQGCPQHLGIS